MEEHPLWPKMQKALGTAEYLHTVITLAAASFLVDAGNSVVLHEAPVGRAADLLSVVGPSAPAAYPRYHLTKRSLTQSQATEN